MGTMKWKYGYAPVEPGELAAWARAQNAAGWILDWMAQPRAVLRNGRTMLRYRLLRA